MKSSSRLILLEILSVLVNIYWKKKKKTLRGIQNLFRHQICLECPWGREAVHRKEKWASPWDYGTYHIGDQRRLRRACASAQSRQSLHRSQQKAWIGSRRRVRPKIKRMAAHARLKKKFTVDKKYHILMTWLKWKKTEGSQIPKTASSITQHKGKAKKTLRRTGKRTINYNDSKL